MTSGRACTLLRTSAVLEQLEHLVDTRLSSVLGRYTDLKGRIDCRSSMSLWRMSRTMFLSP